MNVPCVFLSAATIDLRPWRELLAKAFKAAQFNVIVQDQSLGAPLGNVRDLLVDAIAQCDCIIHLAGMGYGGEAAAPFPEMPGFRCSWTQFEYYHGHLIGMPVLGFVCAPDLSTWEKSEAGDETERALKARLQVEHRDRVTSGNFVGTPCSACERTLNSPSVHSTEDFLVRVAEAIATLQRKHTTLPAAAFQQVQQNLLGMRLLHTIPAPSAFTGRVAELDHLLPLSGAVITGLRGMGGIGKTALAYRLAQEWAPRFPDAAILLDGVGLKEDAAPTAAQLLEKVIRAFHPDAGNLPEDEAALRGLYLNILHGKKALILLDNAKDAAQAQPLLPPPGCALIVTSRATFRVGGCAPYAVGKMKDAEAAVLLRAAYPALTEAELAELIRLCAGLPLALRLAAAHLELDAVDRNGTAYVAGYLRKLGSGRLATLNADAPDAGEITISETLRLSVDLLTPGQQAAWKNLAIFSVDFEAEAAQEIAGADADMLHHFLRRSLLEPVGADRYKLHDLAADYARSQLSDEETTALTLTHARHYTAVGDAAHHLYQEKGNHLTGLALFDRERAQVEAAWAALDQWQDEAAAGLMITLVNAIAYFGDLRFHPRQRIAWLESQLRAARFTDHREAAGTALGNLGNAHYSLGNVRKAIGYYEERLVIAREIGDRRGQGAALGNLGIAHATLGDARKAIGYYEEQLVIAREIGERRVEGNALGNLGLAHADLGDAQKAVSYYDKQLEIVHEIGDRRGEGNALWNSALSYESLGERAEALRRVEAALEIYEAIEDPFAANVRKALASWKAEATDPI